MGKGAGSNPKEGLGRCLGEALVAREGMAAVCLCVLTRPFVSEREPGARGFALLLANFPRVDAGNHAHRVPRMQRLLYIAISTGAVDACARRILLAGRRVRMRKGACRRGERAVGLCAGGDYGIGRA